MSGGGPSFPATWPADCPPSDSADADAFVFRAVNHDPPTADDFLSYIEEGKTVRDPAKRCQASGISVQGSLAAARHHRAVFPGLYSCIAQGALKPAHGKLKATPNKRFPEHQTWWPFEGVVRERAFAVVER